MFNTQVTAKPLNRINGTPFTNEAVLLPRLVHEENGEMMLNLYSSEGQWLQFEIRNKGERR